MGISPFLPDVEEHLAAHIRHLQAAARSPATISARVDVILRARWEVGVPLATATTQQLATWLARPGWSRSTRSIYRYHVRAYLSWMYEAGLCDRDPSHGLAQVRLPKRLPKPITDETLAEILAKAKEPFRTYILIAAYGGLRCAEIAALDRDDITQQAMTVLGKGGKVRIVPTHPKIWEAVRKRPSGPIFHVAGVPPDLAGRVMSRTCCNYLIRLGYRGVSMHRFRHTFATRMLRAEEQGGAGANIRIVQRLLGHASLQSTEVYTAVTDEELRIAVQKLPAVA